MGKLSYCSLCSAPLKYEVPEGDNRVRPICTVCGEVHYTNPSTVAGAVAVYENRFLLCKRDIEPRIGYWTIPAGYLELEEDVAAGAIRESLEEAHAEIEISRLLAIYSIPHISQTQVIFLAKLLSPDVSAGEESQEVGLFLWEEIPWDELAFPTVKWALELARTMLQDPNTQPQHYSTADTKGRP